MEPTPPGPPAIPSTTATATLFHTWHNKGADDEAYHIAVLGDGRLVTLIDLSAKRYNSLLDTLRNSNLAAGLEAQKGARSIELASVQAIELTPVFKLLRLSHTQPDSKTRQLKLKASDAQDLQPLFDHLVRLTAGRVEVQPLTAWMAIREPLGGLALTLFLGAIAIWGAANADPNYEPTGTRQALKRLLNWLGLWLGPWGTAAIVVAGVIALGVWIHRRLTVRPDKHIIRLG